MSDSNVFRIKPLHYIHILDHNTNLTRVVVGPKTYTRQEHEKVVKGPDRMIMIPPRCYCTIANPVVRNEEGEVSHDQYGNYQLKHQDTELRFAPCDPFPLYPGERMLGPISKLTVIPKNRAIRVVAVRDFTDKNGVKRVAGDEWLFKGPGTYIPRIEEKIDETINAQVIPENVALKLRAKRLTKDHEGNVRQAGETWLVTQVGAYIPGVDEIIEEQVTTQVLTPKRALHLTANSTFKDRFGVVRKPGDKWLVTIEQTESLIPDVYEKVSKVVPITALSSRQFCVVLNPVDPKTGKNQWGGKELRVGERTFFLHPGEELEDGIQNIFVLAEDEALLLRAKESYTDGEEVRKPGHCWMIKGPRDYVPPVQVEIVEKRKSIPLDENEGIYVRDMRSGKVRMVQGQSYMLAPHEQLWEKILSPEVEELLSQGTIRNAPGRNRREYSARNKNRVVTYRAPHNSAVQIYDFKAKKARVVFGPEQVLLGPDEEFTLVSLSGGTPKVEHSIKDLSLRLGPDFMTDRVDVETSDHARLELQVAYNWHFQVDKSDVQEAQKIFAVPDFVGDACKAIASRIRGAVAQESFDDFHKNSADLIKRAVFGKDKEGNIRTHLFFNSNNLVISNIDIQSVEPSDVRTRDALQKSVQLAIEITTKSQEARAKQLATRKEQKAKGELERQKIKDEIEAEKQNITLIQLKARSKVVEESGELTAQAKALAAAAEIRGNAAVSQAKLQSETVKIKATAELSEMKMRQEAELEHQKRLHELEVVRAQKLAEIESKKFSQLVDAIGTETIKSIARSGPETQAKLLQGLGLKSFLITDGNSPINLFNTANGLLGGPQGQQNTTTTTTTTNQKQSMTISGLGSDVE